MEKVTLKRSNATPPNFLDVSTIYPSITLPNSLKKWLHSRSKENIEIAFVSGNLFFFTLNRFLFFFGRRFSLLLISSLRTIYCLKSFVWFSWMDFISLTALCSLLIGLHFGALEPLKHALQKKDLNEKTKLSDLYSFTRFMTLGFCLFLGFIGFKDLLPKIIFDHYRPNVFDEIRIFIILKTISHLYRNLCSSYQVKRGLPPLPFFSLISLEILMTGIFLGTIHFFGAKPSVLLFNLFIDSFLPECLSWFWLRSQPYLKKVSLIQMSDLRNPLRIARTLNSDTILSAFGGLVSHSERYLLLSFLTIQSVQSDRSNHDASIQYLIFLPLCSVFFRFSNLFSRHFRVASKILRRELSKTLFLWSSIIPLFCALLFSIVLKTETIQSLFHFELKQNEMMILLITGPLGALLSYCLYQKKLVLFLTLFFSILYLMEKTFLVFPVLFFLFFIFTLIHGFLSKKTEHSFYFKVIEGDLYLAVKNIQKKISFRLEPYQIHQKTWTAFTKEKNIEELKREIFIELLGKVIFQEALNLKSEKSTISTLSETFKLGSLKTRHLNLTENDKEEVLKKVKKALIKHSDVMIALQSGLKLRFYDGIFKKIDSSF